MAAVRRGVDQDVLRRRSQRAVERDFERFVGGIAGIKRKVVAKDDEAFGAFLDKVNGLAGAGDDLLYHGVDFTNAFVESLLGEDPRSRCRSPTP